MDAFIEAYRATWEAVIRGEAPLDDLTDYFGLPCLMVSGQGAVTLYQSASEIVAFNRTRLDAFRAGGVVRAQLCGSDVQSQGPHLSLATVNWVLLRGDGTTERAWRHYYTILNAKDAPAIVVSAFQTGS